MLNPAILNTYPILPYAPHPYHHHPTPDFDLGSRLDCDSSDSSTAASHVVGRSIGGGSRQQWSRQPTARARSAERRDKGAGAGCLDIRCALPKPEACSPVTAGPGSLTYFEFQIGISVMLNRLKQSIASAKVSKPPSSRPAQAPKLPQLGLPTNHAPVSRSLPNFSRNARSSKTNMPTLSRSCASCRRTACSAATTGAAPLAAHTTR